MKWIISMQTLKRKDWNAILKKLKEEYHDTPSIFLMRSKMKEVLGFTPRVSRNTDERFERYIHLDFFDEAKETYFILKYL